MTIPLALNNWLGQPRRVAWHAAQQTLVNRLSKHWLNASCVQLGLVDGWPALRPAEIRHFWVMDVCAARATEVDVQAKYLALPLADDSVDNLIAPLVLDFEQNLRAQLAEMHRVLSGGGQLLCIGLNPYAYQRGVSVLKRDALAQSDVQWRALQDVAAAALPLGFELKVAGYLPAPARLSPWSAWTLPFQAPLYYLSLRKLQRPLTLRPVRSTPWWSRPLLVPARPRVSSRIKPHPGVKRS